MDQITCHFFGQFAVQAGGVPVTEFHSDKARALLVYLALEPQLHTRRSLAALFWPEIGERYALTNLRNTLYRLRQTLDVAGPERSDRLLTVTRQAIQCNTDYMQIDVLHFQSLLDTLATLPTPRGAVASTVDAGQLVQLAEAVILYKGELLVGFHLEDAPAFEEWLQLRREMLKQRFLLALRTLTTGYETAGAYEKALAVAHRLVELEPRHEEAYQQSMRLLARVGQPDQALQLYAQMRHFFHEELAALPSQATMALVRQITTGELDSARTDHSSPQILQPPLDRPEAQEGLDAAEQQDRQVAAGRAPPVITPPLPAASPVDLGEVPEAGPFFGRTTESRQLEQWLAHDGCRLVALLGIGGMGKTSLAADCVRQMAGNFDAVFWRSLVNAPPIEELLLPLLQQLSDQQISHQQLNGLAQTVSNRLTHRQPEETHGHGELLRWLMYYAREQRILLVLDNLESILDTERAGAFRTGYEAYGQLIHQFALHTHQSHLLLTSRERPHGYGRLERDSPLVRSLYLYGLDRDAGHALLARRGLYGEQDEVASLITHYSGNPLALKLVADTVDEIFGGSIAEFLSEETPVFDDIRTVLDQQLARLSALEREILYWLAVEREAMPLPELRQRLVHPPATSELIEALRGLQRRSLSERRDVGFGLQNVVTEYITDRLVREACHELETGKLYLLHRQALFIAAGKVYVRESQARLILQPIGTRLLDSLGRTGLQEHLYSILAALRTSVPRLPSYAAGNLLNLLLYLGFEVTGLDLSQLAVWQCDLQNVFLHHVNFAGADLSHTLFSGNFGLIRTLAIGSHSEIRWEDTRAQSQEMLAAGTGSAEIHLWGLESGQPEGVLRGHRHIVISVAMSPRTAARPLLASASGDGTIGIWDLGTKTLLHMLGNPGPSAGEPVRPLRVVTFSPDGRLLASGGEDHKIRLWRVESGELLATIEQHRDWVNALSFHPAGHLLASGGNDHAIYLWDLPTLLRPAQTNHTAPVQETLREANIRMSLQGHHDTVYSLAFSPDGSQLASSSGDRTVRLWDVASGGVLHVLEGHSGVIWSVAFSPNGATLASGSADHTVRLWDVSTGRALDTLRGHTHAIRSVAFSADSKTLVSGGLDDAIRLWDVRSPSRWQAYKLWQGYTEQIMDIAFSADGAHLAAGTLRGTVHVWDTHNPTAPQRLPPRHLHEAEVRAVAASPNSPFYASAGFDGAIRIWHVNRQEHEVLTPRNDQSIQCLAYAHGGTLLASAGDDGLIHLWNVDAAGKHHFYKDLSGYEATIRALAFSPDDQHLASAAEGEPVRIWQVEPGNCVFTLEGGVPDCLTLAFHPDGGLLAGGGRDGRVYLWSRPEEDKAQWTLARTLPGHQSGIHRVAFSPDGLLLATASSDRTIGIWDAKTGDQIHLFDEHSQDVWSLSFQPGGAILASGSFDGEIKLWDVHTGLCLHTLSLPGLYADMNITGITGISAAQKAALRAMGAVEEGV